MKSGSFWALLPHFLAASMALAARAPLASISKSKASKLPGNVVPNQFIMEVDSLSNIPTKRSFARPLDAVYASLQDRDINFKVKKEYDSADLFVGAAVTIKTKKDLEALRSTPGIKNIRPIVQYQSPRPVTAKVVYDSSDPAVPADSQSTHLMTGVDKLHAQGIEGSGIKIGVIDTGVDYTHPALGGGFGPGFKVIGGYDFVGSAFIGNNTPVPGPDPIDKCNGHGTHVSGIIGADPGNSFNISGVAYKASLFAYRVFGCNGSVTDDILVDALLRGVKDGNDILTLSIGGPDGWTEGTASVVASRIAASGKIVTIAAGNEGEDGSWYSSSPSNGIDAISVASVDNTIIPLQSVLVSGVQHDPITYYSNAPLPTTGSFPIYATSNDTTIVADACDPLPSTTPDLSKFVTIVRRGSCNFVQKLQNVADKGAKLVLVYDNGRGFAGIVTDNFPNVALIQSADGEFLVKQLVAGASVTLTFPTGGHPVQFVDPHGGLVSSFTTYGPSNDFYFKPAVAAPGGNILSTYPTTMGSYAVLSGTSMATPFVAGSYALLLQVKGKSKAVTSSARSLFQTTAQIISSSKTDGDPLQTVTQQGAGLINVHDAIFSTTVVSPGELVLNDTAHFKPEQTFTVKNNGNSSTSYTLRHVPAGTALTIGAGSISPALGPVPLTNASASVVLTPAQFTLKPGQSQKVSAQFQLPTSGVDPATYPVFSGFIEVSGPSAADSYHVSYIGLGASLKDKQVLDNTDQFFGVKIPMLLNSTGDAQLGPTNYTFAQDDVPTIAWRLVFGSPSLQIDLVDPNTNFSPTISSRGLDDPAALQTGGSFAQVKIVGSLAKFKYLSRNNEDPETNGFYNLVLKNTSFVDGRVFPNGNYRVLLRALKVTGDPSSEADYESWLSPVFGVQFSNSTTSAPSGKP